MNPSTLRKFSVLFYVTGVVCLVAAVFMIPRVNEIVRTAEPIQVLTKARPNVGEWVLPGFAVEMIDLKIMAAGFGPFAMFLLLAGDLSRNMAQRREEINALRAEIEDLKSRLKAAA